jgi:hypothetical protein
VDRSGRSLVRELGDRMRDPAPGRHTVIVAGSRELIGTSGAFLERLVSVAALHAKCRSRVSFRKSCTAAVDKGFKTGTGCVSRWCGMAPILTAEDVVRRIAAECAYIDDRGGVGIRLEPAAAIVRQYGEQFRRPPRRKQTRRSEPTPLL